MIDPTNDVHDLIVAGTNCLNAATTFLNMGTVYLVKVCPWEQAKLDTFLSMRDWILANWKALGATGAIGYWQRDKILGYVHKWLAGKYGNGNGGVPTSSTAAPAANSPTAAVPPKQA